MENCGSMLKSALVVVVIMAVIQSGSAAEKLASCCKKVNRQEITEEILDYLVQPADPPCVRAVIFQTKTGLFCSQLTAPWVRRRIIAIEKAKAKAVAASSVVSSSPVSLLSIITSTASPPSSSSLPPSSSSLPPSSSSLPPSSSSLPPSSSSSTYEMPTGETSSTSSQ